MSASGKRHLHLNTKPNSRKRGVTLYDKTISWVRYRIAI